MRATFAIDQVDSNADGAVQFVAICDRGHIDFAEGDGADLVVACAPA